MTSTTSQSSILTSEQSPRRRLPVVLITNVCVAVFMLIAIPVIHSGQKGFLPHAAVNKDYVNAAINSGQADFMHKALKTTEIARAMAHDNHIHTMTFLQIAVGGLAILFFLNSFYLFRLHRGPQPARIPRES